MPLSEWLENRKKDEYTTLTPASPQKSSGGVKEGSWLKCQACGEPIYQKEFKEKFNVCPKCGFNGRLSAYGWATLLIDGRSFVELEAGLCSKDPLGFVAEKSYLESVKKAQKETGLKEAAVVGCGKLGGKKVVLAVLDFSFIGGSMGSVVGEKVTRAIEKAAEEKLPLITVSTSGGARMQEGMFSLMQMAKTSSAVGRLRQVNVPFISILANPTTGGVTASFATLADIIIAEPHALVGFAGPRVIEKTIKRKLPKDFQTAEFLLERGMIDMVVPRAEMKETIAQLLDFTNQRQETRCKD